MFADKKVIIITPERLGHTLMCTPAIHYLKQCYPTVSIDVIALSELSAEVLKNNPDIHHTFVLPSQKLLKNLKLDHTRVINIHDGPLAREYIKVLNVPVEHIGPDNKQLHQAEQALQFIQSLLPEPAEILDRTYKLYPDSEDTAQAQQLLHAQGIDFNKDILIGLHAGCHSIAKKKFSFLKKMSHPKIWLFERIVELGRKLYQENPHFKIILTGSGSEKILGKKLTRLLPNVINLIDQTSVLQLGALLKMLRVFISPDTGLMHVACTTDTPLIALFGYTELNRTGPYPSKSPHLTLIRAPTMAGISADSVFKAVMRVLEKNVETVGAGPVPALY